MICVMFHRHSDITRAFCEIDFSYHTARPSFLTGIALLHANGNGLASQTNLGSLIDPRDCHGANRFGNVSLHTCVSCGFGSSPREGIEEMTQPISLPARSDTPSAPLGSKVSSHSPASNSGIARVSWNDEERSPAKKDIEDYLFTYLWLHRASTKVEMRTSRRSAFVVCSSEEGASTSKRASYVRTVRYSIDI